METFTVVEDEPHDPSPNLVYNIHDKPPWFLAFLLGIQHCLTSVGACLVFPIFLGNALCILEADPARDQLVSTILLVSGLSTLFQLNFGVRLPVVQGPSFGVIACVLSSPYLFHWNCPSDAELYAMGNVNRTAEWQDRMQEIQGAIISVSLLEMFIGYSGLIGFVIYYMSPIVIAPTMLFMGMSFVTSAESKSTDYWLIATVAFVVLLVFWQYLQALPWPVPWYSSSRGVHLKWVENLQIFPIIICVVSVSSFYWILESYDVIHLKQSVSSETEMQWFHLPYPFQWGLPRFTANAFVAAMASTLISLTSSISNHYCCVALCDKLPPPLAAISRGVGAEGFSCLLAGLFGTGSGMTTTPAEIATIGITRVGNRRVIACGSLVMIFLAVFPFVRRVLYLIPSPVVGALMFAMLIMATGVGLSFLQYVNMKSYRNIFVLGCGLCCPLIVPQWDQEYSTGLEGVDIAFKLLFSSRLFMASLLTFLLDIIIPGNLKDRGIILWQRSPSHSRRKEELAEYDCPSFGLCSCRSIRDNALLCVEKAQFL